ncbi:YbcC family protein [Marinobacter sp. VGCF2001]|uniref:YbcC family protein n=1 Tax=Marinobacter sp. VGCF2001 TaxID=3417189 RepID=UPI003CF27819
MNAPVTGSVSHQQSAPERIHEACERVAPIWPMDRWIAVNPWWGSRYQPVEHASRELDSLLGAGLLMPPGFYREAWDAGRIQRTHLEKAVLEAGVKDDEQTLLSQLSGPPSSQSEFVSALGYRLQGQQEPALREARDDIGGICARYFDVRQNRWRVSGSPQDLYQFWRGQTAGPRGRKGDHAAALPATWQDAATAVARELPYSSRQLPLLAHHLLGQLLGWASWCRGVDWRAGLGDSHESGHDQFCAQLATIWLIYEARAFAAMPDAEREAWQKHCVNAFEMVPASGREQALWVWHRAYEMAWQTRFLSDLGADQSQGADDTETVAEVQAAFCIDVRSEVMRRQFEQVYPQARTLGVAGFFGMPIVHHKHGPADDEARLPGLLAPAYRYSETLGNPEDDRAWDRKLDQREQVRESVRRAKYSSLSTFTLVETTGLAWAWKLVRDSLNKNSVKKERVEPGRLHHCVDGYPLSDPERVKLAEGMLRAMSLTQGFASLLLMVGHGAHTDNNPNEAGLACGACGGKNGGVNARVAAELLNDRQVRAGLAEKGIVLPESTIALAAEHCTITDTVTVYGQEQVPESHRRILKTLLEKLDQAGAACRRERASGLGLDGETDKRLLAELNRRTRNWAEVRPEWGLANNAGMVIGPRTLTRSLNLGGRCFLHDYDPGQDPSGEVLTLLMSAPMVVANWINLQYFGSVARPSIFGAGNKLLHSVVGGNLGVVEGNDVDLQIGLPLQSVFDGEHWRHEPVRLTVVIDAPAERIEAVIQANPDVRALVHNRWLWLHRIESGKTYRYDDGRWLAT